MYVNNNRRGLGIPWQEAQNTMYLRGYQADQTAALALRDALREKAAAIAAPVPVAARVPTAQPQQLPLRAIARRPVQIQIRRAIAVPNLSGGRVISPRGMGSVSTFITNLTKNGAVFAAGDSWELDITGAPNSTVSISGTHDGRDMGNTPMGTTDANGRFVLRASMTPNEVGLWNEFVHVGTETSAPLYFEVVAARTESGGVSQPTSANVVPTLQFQGSTVTSNTPAGAILVPDLRTHLLAIEQTAEDSYSLQHGISPEPAIYRSQMSNEASMWCSRYPEACAGVDRAAALNEVVDRYTLWYNATLAASWNLIDRTGSTAPAGMPPRPAGYVAPTPTSGPGWAALQTSGGGQQPAGGSSTPSSIVQQVPQQQPAQQQQYPTYNSAPPIPPAATAAGSVPPAAANAIGDSLTSFFSGGFDVAGIHVPMIAAAAALGALWFFGGGSRRG